MIKKVLIANRGEIARRIIRTCKTMGIRTVAVYSDADKHALFVEEADEGYLLGGPRVKDSYLNIKKIVGIAKQAGADAVHPGYGLLSENHLFAESCQKEGLIFVGPASDVIKKMGNKIEARTIMEKAGVPVIPGRNQPVRDEEEAVALAYELGYPVMVKASAGGGGIGMEAAWNEEQLRKAYSGNTKRAEAFFGDGTMFIEKKIENPRHIEVQILADHQGKVIHLFERECSIQRRNQKVIEEAPSPFLSDWKREEICNAAITAARNIQYANAGTVEFLVDEKENFYFLEMNTRLQVEHPVTEEVTGVDIVEQQFHIANRKPLSITQEDIRLDGHAIETRIYAEHPVTFYPSPGQITEWQLPQGRGIRHEMAVRKNSVVTPYYDPLIGKLIIKAATRENAVACMEKALKSYKVEGIDTNIDMLIKVVSHEAFRNGKTTTNFIRQYYFQQIHPTSNREG